VPTTASSVNLSPAISPNRALWIGGLCVALLTIAAHIGGLRGQFVEWDDTTHITQNPAIRALTLDNLRAMFTQPVAKLYCPLTWLSFAFDYQLWGREPFGYHLTNLLLHLANTLLVLVLVYRLLEDRLAHARPAAVLTAAIFGVHPLRAESVAWVTERKDVLFAFFFLLALLAYRRWVLDRRRGAYGTCLLLFVAAALSKSTAVTFPVVLLLLDIFWQRRRAFAEKIPFFLVSAIIGVVTFAAQSGGTGQTVATADIIPVWGRAGLVGFCALFYVGKFLWPANLTAIYPAFDEMGWRPLHAAGWLLALLVVTGIVFALHRRAPLLWPAWLFYLVTLSPTIGLVPVGIHVVADRFSYLPLLGLALPVAVGFAGMLRAWPKLFFIPAALVAGLAALTVKQTKIWRDTETLFQHALAANPNCLPAHVNLTVWYTQRKQYNDAIAHGQRAVAIAPQGLPGRKNLAFALINAGRYHEAVTVLRDAVDAGVADADVWRALAECFTALGDEPNARAAREQLQRLNASLKTPD